ncbi:hypothetical protein A4H97_24705 [Niastella yeongjuensis]|uniref:DUF2116 family Zn-ribbon domain-containing protein n=1 Tax=Niastella yeongjuensis TaxID=354355 RepID=A0A1V9F2Q5_9BACT|nr:hypothetical protein [Niastella yeongjuensis]OQP52532.1 hypothetical protein A4H97_24705 [Niastella yeongjuensis]SEP34776.1 hypothetical protein SAMN05660816_05410 [Niastella yeongjuensis]
MKITARICLACESPIVGRIDKKFCDDSCRNHYNNQMNDNYASAHVRNVNNILRRNRRILEELLAPLKQKKVVIARQRLVEAGFHFGYITEHHQPNKKSHYYYCYEYGYRSIDQEKVLAIKDTRKKRFAR